MDFITFPDLLRFCMQISSSIAGASALAGFVFARRSQNALATGGDAYLRVARVLMPVFFVSAFLFVILWSLAAFVVYPSASLAHEGVAQKPQLQYIYNGFRINTFFVGLFALALAAGSFLLKKRSNDGVFLQIFYAVQFSLVSVISFFFIFTGSFNKEQLMYFLHNWHSILTFGSVVVVDVLYLISLKRASLRHAIYTLFPLISAWIWVGLAFEFLSSFMTLSFSEGLSPDVLGHVRERPQFLFNQTILAVIILNGAFLSGRINKILIEVSARGGKAHPPVPWMRIMQVSGVVSFTSWFTITFIDFFEAPLSYLQFFAAYLVILGGVYAANVLLENKVLKQS